jgi:hypothetical protein
MAALSIEDPELYNLIQLEEKRQIIPKFITSNIVVMIFKSIVQSIM